MKKQMLSILERNGNDNVGQAMPDKKKTAWENGTRFIIRQAEPDLRFTNFTSDLHLTYNGVGFTPSLVIPTLRAAKNAGYSEGTSGFTLIELLVVVLIIGILAAVALPQYQKAVEKSRVATVLAAIKPIVDAEETYYLANGQYTTDIDSLGVDLPAGATPTTTGSKKYNLPNGQQISLDGANDTYGVVCGVTKHVQLDAVLQNSSWSGLPPGGIYCGAFSSDKIGLQVCKSFGSTQKANTLTVGCIINNTQDGCEWYRILL